MARLLRQARYFTAAIRFDSGASSVNNFFIAVTHPTQHTAGTLARTTTVPAVGNLLMQLDVSDATNASVWCRSKKVLSGASITWSPRWTLMADAGLTLDTLIPGFVSAGDGAVPVSVQLGTTVANGGLGVAMPAGLFIPNGAGLNTEGFAYFRIVGGTTGGPFTGLGAIGITAYANPGVVSTNNDWDIEFILSAWGD